MPGSGLIADYLDALARQLPRPVVEELADGLEETRKRYLRLGLAAEAAARAAVAEFGDPQLIAAEFARGHPARRAARRLLAIGPAVGCCWAAVLVTGRAWTWPLPVAAYVMVGLALLAVITAQVVAGFSTRYRQAARAGTGGCVGIAALDTVVIVGVAVADPALTGMTIVAMTASALRVVLCARLLRPVLARK
jgi:hypothetical protein